MSFDIVDVTDRVAELVEYYTVEDPDGGRLLVDMDAWHSDDIQEIVGLLTLVLRERGVDVTLEEFYEDTLEGWLDRQIDEALEEAIDEWEEYAAKVEYDERH